MSRSSDTASQIREQVNERAGALIPTHVANRVALLTGGQPIQFIDAPLTRELYELTGSVHIFTDQLLVIAELSKVGMQARHDSPWTGDVTATALPRRSLVSMVIGPAGPDYQNDNSLWAGADVLRWPNHGELRLQYRHRDEAVVIGKPNAETYGQGTSPLDDFMDSLVADLSASDC